MSAQSKELSDMILDDNSVHLPLPGVYIVYDYIPRKSQDKGSNAKGTMLLDFCKYTGLRISNGRTGTDKGVGKFTCHICHTHRGQCMVDYVMASTDILRLFCYFIRSQYCTFCIIVNTFFRT